jgi:hypothetical protein
VGGAESARRSAVCAPTKAYRQPQPHPPGEAVYAMAGDCNARVSQLQAGSAPPSLITHRTLFNRTKKKKKQCANAYTTHTHAHDQTPNTGTLGGGFCSSRLQVPFCDRPPFCFCFVCRCRCRCRYWAYMNIKHKSTRWIVRSENLDLEAL